MLNRKWNSVQLVKQVTIKENKHLLTLESNCILKGKMLCIVPTTNNVYANQ